MKKILSMILVLVMTVSGATVATKNTEAASTGTVTVTVEKMSIGQGFLIAPTQIAIYTGDTVATVFERLMTQTSKNYALTTTGYLAKIAGADTRQINIPDEIASKMSVYTYTDLNEHTKQPQIFSIAKPNNVTNTGNKDEYLGTDDYSEMSGWVFTKNNVAYFSNAEIDKDNIDYSNPDIYNIYQSMRQVKVNNGDVIRYQFSVYGFGADVGIDNAKLTGIARVPLADKTQLLKGIGSINQNKAYWLVYPNVAAAYNHAVSVAQTYNASQADVDAAITALRAADDDPVNPVVPKASIKKAVNVKGKKIRLTVKPITGANGYQIKYSNNSKFKVKKKKKNNCVTVKTTKKTYTTKKIKNLKKNKKAYIKFRGYRNVNGTTIYGAWSAKKAVKIKK